MTNLPEFPNAMKALDEVQVKKLACPYRCRIRKPEGLTYEAEITVSTQGYCLSAVEPNRLYRDLQWLEYLERRTHQSSENTNAETQQSPSTEVGKSTT